MDRSRHSRGLPRLCTLRQRCRQSPQRSSRVPNRSMWMILYSSVSSTLVTVCAFSPSCFLVNVSTSTSILFLSMAVNNSPQRIRCIEVSSPGQPAVKLLEPNHFSSNYTFGTGTEKSKKTLKGDFGEIEIATPRDREATFEPRIIAKGQTRMAGLDAKILSMYARGMTTRDLQGHLEEIYGGEVSPTLISNVTDEVLDEVRAWQNRPLDAVYPIGYLDALVVKMREEGTVQNRAVYVAIGITMEGHKEVLGLWTSANEGAKFWLSVLNELKTRGVEDLFIACVDGLKGFPQAIEAGYPKTTVQLCIVHMVRASLRFV